MVPPTSVPKIPHRKGTVPVRHQAVDDPEIRRLTVSTTAIETKQREGKRASRHNFESRICAGRREQKAILRDSSWAGAMMMLVTKEQRPAIRTLRGWAVSVLHEVGAIHECESHGWMQDRADPHARERAITIAQEDSPAGVSPDVAVAAIREVLDSIGDACPECAPEDWSSRGSLS